MLPNCERPLSKTENRPVMKTHKDKPWVFFAWLEMPGIEPGASYMQSMRSTTELHPLCALRSFCQHTISVGLQR